MKRFTYIIQDEVGLHARPAGLLVKTAKELDSSVTVCANGKSASVTKLFAVMSLGIRKGDAVEIEIDGGDEEKSLLILQTFFESNL